MPRRVLVVDDIAANRVLLEALLDAHGYEVVTASSGAEALSVVERSATDLVLLDVMMPQMDGIEVCRRVRQELGLVTLPIVFVTAADDRDARIRGRDVGGDDFLTKPIDQVELLARVRNLLLVKAWHDEREMEFRVLEERYQRAQQQLIAAERLETVGTLAAGIAHELASVLGIFAPTLEAVTEDAARGMPADREDLQLLAMAQEHLANHTERLRGLGRPTQEQPGALDLREVLNGVLLGLRAARRLTGIGVEIIMPAEPLSVLAPRVPTEQVLVNIIANAADAIATANEPSAHSSGRITFRAWPDDTGRRIYCAVSDTGPGIPESLLGSVFEPWVTTKGPDHGTGLGLAVATRIVEGLGGSLEVVSTVGQGATFTFDLPAAGAREGLVTT